MRISDWSSDVCSSDLADAGIGAGEMVTSVFFGGGTPSLMPPETAAAILAAVRRRWRFADDVEITLEANPNSAERSDEHTSEPQSLMRNSYAVFCLSNKRSHYTGLTIYNTLPRCTTPLSIPNTYAT